MDDSANIVPPAGDLTRLFRILADDTRFRLLRLLWKEELTVNELSEITQLAQPRISNHLKILREEKLLSERRSGSWRFYRADFAAGDGLDGVWSTLRASWSEKEQFLADDRRLAEVLSQRVASGHAGFFDELAARWDDIRDSLFGDALGREILRTFIPPGLVVADVGTGTGYVIELFGSRAGRIIAIDHSEAMIQQAREKVKRAGLTNVEFRLADAEENPLRPEEADIVTVVQVLHHFSDPGEAVSAFAAAIKPGGLLLLSDFLPHKEAWLREDMQHRWPGFSREQVAAWFAASNLDLRSFGFLPGRIYQRGKGPRLMVPDSFVAVGGKIHA